MTLQYGQYFMSGSVDEIIEFITKMTPCTVTTNINGTFNINNEEDIENLLNGFKVNKQ